MARLVFDYDPPDRFITGTVGQPGSRTFFLQARDGVRVTSVVLEKDQVAMLSDRVDELLDEVMRRTGGTAAVPATAPAGSEDTDPLDTPIEEEFRVGTMSLAWDGEHQQVVIECYAEGTPIDDEDDAAPEDDDPEDGQGGTVLRVALTGAQARAFAKRAHAVVAAGRPPCPFCAGPLDPQGHICPRSNGHRR